MNILKVIISDSIVIMIFEKLNSKYDFFKDIRSKIKNLEEKKERKLRIISYILVLMVYVITSSIIGNMIVQGVIIGILISFRDACFKNSLNEQY